MVQQKTAMRFSFLTSVWPFPSSTKRRWKQIIFQCTNTESAVEVNNVTVFTKGVFDVSRVLGGPIYASLPGLLCGKESLYKDLGLDTPDAQKYESLVS